LKCSIRSAGSNWASSAQGFASILLTSLDSLAIGGSLLQIPMWNGSPMAFESTFKGDGQNFSPWYELVTAP